MSDTILVRYGRIDKRADEYLVSSGSATIIDASLFRLPEEKIVSWDDLDADTVSELMIWENVSSQDTQYIEGLAE